MKGNFSTMRNETLSRVLKNINLSECEYLRDGLYYIKTIIKQMVFDPDLQKEKAWYSTCEFVIITENGIKKAIIYNCGNTDLHWYTFVKWRNQGVLSRALRSGIIKELWPEIKSVTCCYDWNDNREKKYRMTEHLASLAGLEISDEPSCWITE